MGRVLDQRVVVSVLVLLGVAVVSLVASAQLGGANGVNIPYSGRLELNGQPVTGQVLMRFQVARVQQGLACYQLDLDVPVADGVFAVLLEDVPENCVGDGAVYLGVLVHDGGTFAELGDRKRIEPALGAMTTGGGDLVVASAAEIFFQDNGQIRSHDDDHRIRFRRSENILELREVGDVIISSGPARGGDATTATFTASGDVVVDRDLLVDRDVRVARDASVAGTLEVDTELAFPSSGSYVTFAQQPGGPYEIGHQNGTIFFRAPNFSWFKGGTFNDEAHNPGVDGVRMMSLDSDGVLKVADLPVPVAEEPLRVVRGVVQPGGGIKSGTGFSVQKHPGDGMYTLFFEPPFGDVPSVVVTQRSSGQTPNTRDNCVITAHAFTESTATVRCGSGEGSASDRWFSFIAMGAP